MGMWADAELILRDVFLAKLLFAADRLLAEYSLIGLLMVPFEVGEPPMLAILNDCFV